MSAFRDGLKNDEQEVPRLADVDVHLDVAAGCRRARAAVAGVPQGATPLPA